MANQSISNEIYRNRYVTGSLLRSFALTFFLTIGVLMFPTSVGFGIALAMVIVFLGSDWSKSPETSQLAFALIASAILGLVAVGMLFHGIRSLIKICGNFLRIAYSRHCVFSGQSLASVEGQPRFTGLDEGETMEYHVGNRTFTIDDCSPAGREKLLNNYNQVRVWYVSSTDILVKVEKL